MGIFDEGNNTNKKETKQRKYKNGTKANPVFYIFHQSLLIIFLILLSNKIEQPKHRNVLYQY